MVMPARGEIWWGERPDSTPRPFLVLTRNEAIPLLNKVLVAAVTRTVRGIPTEVALGPAEGVTTECVASFDNMCLLRKSYLTRKMGAVNPARTRELCDALQAAVDC